MYKEFAPTINDDDNLLITLGDSFTQGVGAYPYEVWLQNYKNRYFNITGEKYLDEQYQNNWSTQLVKNHLPTYKAFNLAINGIGNRAAAKELYLNKIPKVNGNVIVVFMLSGTVRFDFLKKNHSTRGHLRWETIWPIPDLHQGASIQEVEKWYAYNNFCEENSLTEVLMTIADVENFCKARNYKFVFATAFDDFFFESAKTNLPNYEINWDNFYPENLTKEFLKLENAGKNLNSFASGLKLPSKYITPCGHWTIEGQKIVAEKIYSFIKNKGYCE